jgi:drug/metabolite transporter (DMT)-like permease
MSAIPDVSARPQRGIHKWLVLYSFLMATSFPIGAAIASTINPLVLTFIRFVIAAAIFGGIMLFRGELGAPSISLIARTGAVAAIMSIFFATMFEALKTASSLNTGAIFTLAPFASLAFGGIINRQPISWPQAACLTVGAMGAIWIVFGGKIENLLAFSTGRGEIIFFMATLLFGLYSPVVRRLHRGESMITFTFWVLVLSAVLTGVLAIPEWSASKAAPAPMWTWIAICYLAAFPTAMTFFIAMRASTIVPAFKVTAYVYLVPAFVAIINGVVLRQVISLSVLAGIVLTMSVTALLQKVELPVAKARAPAAG